MSFYIRLQCLGLVAIIGSMLTANAVLVKKPLSQAVPLGFDAQFQCESNITDAFIEWLKIGDQSRILLPALVVFDGNKVEHHLRQRYTVTRHGGVSTLKIASVTSADVGTYMCTDDDGFGDKATAVLGLSQHLPTTLGSTTIESEPKPVARLIKGDEESNARPVQADTGSNTGLVIGLTAGIIVLLLIILVVFMFVRRYRNQAPPKEELDQESAVPRTNSIRSRLDSGEPLLNQDY